MMLYKQTFPNRQAIADLNEMQQIALEIEQRGANKNRIVDLDLRVQMRVVHWLGEHKVKNPLRPVGPALARARLALRASKLSTRSIGRARDYVYGELWETTARMTLREALQQRIAAGDEQAAEALHVFEARAPEQLDAWIGKTTGQHEHSEIEKDRP